MGVHADIREDRTSTPRELLHVLREHATWKQMNYPRGIFHDNNLKDIHGLNPVNWI